MKLHRSYGIKLPFTSITNKNEVINLLREHSLVILDGIKFANKNDFQEYTQSFGKLLPYLHIKESEKSEKCINYLDTSGRIDVNEFERQVKLLSYPNSQPWHQDAVNYYPKNSVIGFSTVSTIGLDAGHKTSDTAFTSSKLAYDNLSTEFKFFLQKLSVKQTPFWTREYGNWLAEIVDKNLLDTKILVKEIVKLKAIIGDIKVKKLIEKSTWGFEYLNLSFSSYNQLVELLPVESQAIISFLEAEISKQEYCYNHQWEPNQLVIYDNQRLLHRYLDNSTMDHTRIFWRTLVDLDDLII